MVHWLKRTPVARYTLRSSSFNTSLMLLCTVFCYFYSFNLKCILALKIRPHRKNTKYSFINANRYFWSVSCYIWCMQIMSYVVTWKDFFFVRVGKHEPRKIKISCMHIHFCGRIHVQVLVAICCCQEICFLSPTSAYLPQLLPFVSPSRGC